MSVVAKIRRSSILVLIQADLAYQNRTASVAPLTLCFVSPRYSAGPEGWAADRRDRRRSYNRISGRVAVVTVLTVMTVMEIVTVMAGLSVVTVVTAMTLRTLVTLVTVVTVITVMNAVRIVTKISEIVKNVTVHKHFKIKLPIVSHILS